MIPITVVSRSACLAAAVFLGVAALGAGAANAQSAEALFKGKRVTMIIPSGEGGG